MSAVPKPETSDKMVEQLWYAVIGSNGDGMASRLRRVEDSVVELQKGDILYQASRDETCPYAETIKLLAEEQAELKARPAKIALRVVTYILATAGGGFLVILLANAPQIIKLLMKAT